MPAKSLYRAVKQGAYSHVYNKGIDNKDIFIDEEDYKVFTDYLVDYLTVPLNLEERKKTFIVKGRTFRGAPHQPKNYASDIDLLSYSLLPDHFHLILHQKQEGSIQYFIRSLCIRYSIYFNKKYNRNGSLFAGPYKSVEVTDVSLLPHLCVYIHLNSHQSSENAYLKKTDVAWVNTDTVLSILSKQSITYEELTKRYSLGKEKVETLQGLLLEKHSHFEKRPVRASVSVVSPPVISTHKHSYRIPEVLLLSVGFFVLLGFGIRNININQQKSFVLSASAVETPLPVVPVATEEPIQTKIIINTNSAVNIRSEPSVSSPKVAKALDGEIYLLVSEHPEWYEIILRDGKNGFISKQYSKLYQDI